MPQYVNFIIETEDRVFKRANSPDIIDKVRWEYNLKVDPIIVRRALDILKERHDVWYDDVLDMLDPTHSDDIGSFFALKYAFRAEGFEAMDSHFMEPNNEHHTEHIINRLKKRGYNQWA